MDDVQFRTLDNQIQSIERALIELRLDSLKNQIAESTDRHQVELLTREFTQLKDRLNER